MLNNKLCTKIIFKKKLILNYIFNNTNKRNLKVSLKLNLYLFIKNTFHTMQLNLFIMEINYSFHVQFE